MPAFSLGSKFFSDPSFWYPLFFPIFLSNFASSFSVRSLQKTSTVLSDKRRRSFWVFLPFQLVVKTQTAFVDHLERGHSVPLFWGAVSALSCLTFNCHPPAEKTLSKLSPLPFYPPLARKHNSRKEKKFGILLFL